jgi:hypothetical protein
MQIHKNRKSRKYSARSYSIIFYENNDRIRWIETLLQIPIPDNRKYALWRIVAPYLINVRKLSHEDALSIIKEWLDKCEKLRPLVDVNNRIKPTLSAAVRKGYLPISFSDLKIENRQLAELIPHQIK